MKPLFEYINDNKISLTEVESDIKAELVKIEGHENRLKSYVTMAIITQSIMKQMEGIDRTGFLNQFNEDLTSKIRDFEKINVALKKQFGSDTDILDALKGNKINVLADTRSEIEQSLKKFEEQIEKLILERDALPVSELL